MSQIGFGKDSYRALPRLILVDSSFNFIDMGVFEPGLGKELDSYQPEKFIDPNSGEEYYDDSAYKDKPCYVLSLLHRTLGYYPFVRNIGWGHYHDKYIVSKNETAPHDVMTKSPRGDVFILADLVRNPPMSSPDGGNPWEILVEVEPHLNHGEWAKLMADGRFLAQVKQNYIEASSRIEELEAEVYLATAGRIATEANVITLQDRVNTLNKSLTTAYDKVLNLQTSSRKALERGLDTLEGEYNFGIPYKDLALENIEKSVGELRTDMRYLEAMAKMDGTPSENAKQMMIQTVTNVCGIGYVRAAVCKDNIEQHVVETPGGQRTVTMSQKPSLVELVQKQVELRDAGGVSDAQCLDNVYALLEDSRMKFKSNPNPNSAIEELKSDVLRGVDSGRRERPIQR